MLKKLGCDEETEKDEVVLLNSSYVVVNKKSGLFNIVTTVDIIPLNTAKFCGSYSIWIRMIFF